MGLVATAVGARATSKTGGSFRAKRTWRCKLSYMCAFVRGWLRCHCCLSSWGKGKHTTGLCALVFTDYHNLPAPLDKTETNDNKLTTPHGRSLLTARNRNIN